MMEDCATTKAFVTAMAVASACISGVGRGAAAAAYLHRICKGPGVACLPDVDGPQVELLVTCPPQHTATAQPKAVS